MNDFTRILSAIESGDTQAARELFPLVYHELRQLAARQLAQERTGQTLQPTALVHEAYVRLVGSDAGKPWDGRGHFIAAAAEAMRRILVEQARRKRALKRGGKMERQDLELDGIAVEPPVDPAELIALDEALDRFVRIDPVKAELVKLRYFAGLTTDQAARTLGISTATAERYWAYARAWLQVDVEGRSGDASGGADAPC